MQSFAIREKEIASVLEKSKSEDYICSPLNYIGGKYKLLPQIMPLFPRQIRTFVDLFCGGCNVGINAQAERIIFNDNIRYLIELYKCFYSLNKEEVFSHIEHRIEKFNLSLTNGDGYNELRNLYNTKRNPLDLFVLVAYSFNHQIRFNSSHKFNNPFGKDRSSFNFNMKKNLYKFLDALHSKNIEFSCENFDIFCFNTLAEPDFVYCDPPYLITTGTYNDGKRGVTGWSVAEEEKLLNLLEILNQRGIKFGLSNVLTHKGRKNTILSRWIQDNHFHVTHLRKNYSNSNYQTLDRRIGASCEVLVTNYEPHHQQLSFNF